VADEFLVPAVELDDAGWAILAEIVRRFEDRWQSAGAADPADFVPGPRDRLRGPVLVELVKVDQEYRWKRDQPKRVEAYLAEWPELVGKIEVLSDLVRAEWLTRGSLGSPPARDEIEARFPELAGRIDLPSVLADVERGRATACGPAAMIDTPSNRAAQPPGDPAPPLLPVGRRLGRYEIRALVGRGGMGAVYRAFDTWLRREVALKTPHFEPGSDPAILERFLREGRAAAKVWHPNVCAVLDAGEIEGVYYLTMKLVEGESLARRIAHGKLEPREAATLVEKLARGLAAVHAAGMVHRDIKSANVMLEPSGEPLLMDFGLARPTEADPLVTAAGALMGTPAFMSPEQAAGEPIDAQSDVYSLGVVLYHALTGKLPFEGPLPKVLAAIAHSDPPPPRAVCPELDASIEAICTKAMAKRPADRYASANEFAEALGGYLRGEVQPSAPAPRAAVFPRPRWLTWLAVVLAVLAGGILWQMFYRPSPPILPRPTIGQAPLVPIERWIETGATAPAAEIALDGSRLYVAACVEEGSSPVEVYDTASGKRLRTIAFDGDVYVHKGVAVSGDGRYLFVTHYYHRNLSRIDLEQGDARTELPIRGVPGAAYAQGLTVTPDGRKLLVTVGGDGRNEDLDNDQISIVDIADGKFSLLAELRLPDEPIGQKLAVTADGKFAYLVTLPRKSRDPALYEISLTEPYRVTRSLGFPEGRLQNVVVSSRRQQAFVSE
jgi:hypothetical protein